MFSLMCDLSLIETRERKGQTCFTGSALADAVKKQLNTIRLFAVALSRAAFEHKFIHVIQGKKSFDTSSLYWFGRALAKPHLKRKFGVWSLIDFRAVDLARHLTLVEFAQFRNVRARHLVRCNWQRERNSVSELIQMINARSLWIATEIVGTPNPKARTALIERCISLAEEANKLNNFNLLFEVVLALQHGSVLRLAHTWNNVSSKAKASLQRLRVIVDPAQNYMVYRLEFRKRKAPKLPYFGLYTRDVTFVEDGNPELLDGLLNFSRWEFLARAVLEISEVQSIAYVLSEIPEVNQLLQQIVLLSESELAKYSRFVESPGNPLNDLHVFSKKTREHTRSRQTSVTEGSLNEAEPEKAERTVKKRSFFK